MVISSGPGPNFSRYFFIACSLSFFMPRSTCPETWSICSEICSETALTFFDHSSMLSLAQDAARPRGPPAGVSASTAQGQGRVVVADVAHVPQVGDLGLPVGFGHAAIAVPIGARRPLAAASTIRPGRWCKRPANRPDSRIVEHHELHEVVAFQVDAAQYDRIGLELGGCLQGKAPHQLAAADVEEATIADGEALQA